MILGAVIQQPIENLDYDIDVTSLFNSQSDSLFSVVAAVTPAGLTVTAAVLDVSTAKLWVSGGVAGTKYTVEITMTTAQGRVKQDELIVQVEEI